MYLYFADGRLSEAELCAARLDGHLVELGEGWVPADTVETAWMRAASLVPLLGGGLAATHLSAAWVHGALDEPPARHAVQRAVTRRLPHVIGRRVRYRDTRIDPGDLIEIAGIRVTTPVRTLVDLARAPSEAHTAATIALLRLDPGLADRGLAWLGARGVLPHKRAAEDLLRRLAVGQDDVTR